MRVDNFIGFSAHALLSEIVGARTLSGTLACRWVRKSRTFGRRAGVNVAVDVFVVVVDVSLADVDVCNV